MDFSWSVFYYVPGDVEEEKPADDETEAEEKDLWPDRLLEKLKCELPAELALLERELWRRKAPRLFGSSMVSP